MAIRNSPIRSAFVCTVGSSNWSSSTFRCLAGCSRHGGHAEMARMASTPRPGSAPAHHPEAAAGSLHGYIATAPELTSRRRGWHHQHQPLEAPRRQPSGVCPHNEHVGELARSASRSRVSSSMRGNRRDRRHGRGGPPCRANRPHRARPGWDARLSGIPADALGKGSRLDEPSTAYGPYPSRPRWHCPGLSTV